MAASRSRRGGMDVVMYGRDRERTVLHELLDDAVTGRGGLVLISGEAGIGKTTLVQDLVCRAKERCCLILSGGCYDLTTTPPYGPWVDVIRGYSPSADGPEVPSWFGNPDELAKIGSQAALFEETQSFFADIAKQQPLVIVLEDLHWSDTASLDALRYLSRSLSDAPVLIVVTYRDDEITRRDHLSRLLPSLVREADAARISVKRLDEDALRELITADYDLRDDDRERLVTHVAGLSDGNPLYAIELLKTLDDDGVIRRDDDHHTLGTLDTVTVPPLIEQIIERRLARLDPSATRLLEAAAVIGPSFDFQTWLAVSDADEARLLATIDVAQHARLIEEVARTGRYRFHHALIREALYERQMWPQRRTLHRRVGEFLADQPTAEPNTVAHHFHAAGDGRAVEWLVRAGERASRSFAWMIAVDHYTAAAQLLERRPDSTRQRAALLDHIARLYVYEDPQCGLAFCREALSLLPDDSSDAFVVSIQVHHGSLRCNADQVRDGIAEMQAALDRFDGDDAMLVPGAAGLPAREMLGLWLANAGHFHAAVEMWERRRQDLSSQEFSWRFGAARAYAMLGRLEQARTELTESLHRAEFSNDPLLAISAILSEFFYLQLPFGADNLAAMNQIRTRGYAAFIRVVGIVETREHTSKGLFFDPDWEATFTDLTAEKNRITGFWGQHQRAMIAELAYHRGSSAVAWQQVDVLHPDGAATAPGNCNFLAGIELQRIAAHLCLDSGDHASARAWLEAHDRWLGWSGAVRGRAEGYLGWALYHRLAENRDGARQQAAAALEVASDPRQPLALLAAHRFLGELNTAESCLDDAQSHLDAALTLAEACQAPYEIALCQLALAELALAQRETQSARRWLGSVREIVERLGAMPTVQRLDRLDAQLIRLERRTTYPAGLTAREVEVLRLVVEGMTDAEVADVLFISPRTVGQHLRSVYNKLGVNSRVEATRFAVEHGIVTRA